MADNMNGPRHEPNVAAGVLAGVIGGLVGTWAMSEFQALWSRAAGDHSSRSAGGRHDARDWQERNEDQNANEIVAQAIAERTLDRDLTRRELAVAAPAVHYAFGATMGGIYGGLAEVSAVVRSMGGAGWGTAVWAGGDEVAMPLLGLARRDVDYPFEAHAQSFAAHIVYGVTTEVVRRGMRALR